MDLNFRILTLILTITLPLIQVKNANIVNVSFSAIPLKF